MKVDLLAGLLLLLLALAATFPLHAASPTAPLMLTGNPVADYEALKQLHSIHEPAGVERGGDAHYAFILHRARTLRERGLEFIAAHPEHPLRWDVLVLLQHSGSLEVRRRADGSRYAVLPAVEDAVWRQHYLGRLEDLLESADAGRAARQEALMQLIDYYCDAIRSAKIDNPRRGLVPSLLMWVREFHSLDPRSGRVGPLYMRVARMLNALAPPGVPRLPRREIRAAPGLALHRRQHPPRHRKLPPARPQPAGPRRRIMGPPSADRTDVRPRALSREGRAHRPSRGRLDVAHAGTRGIVSEIS